MKKLKIQHFKNQLGKEMSQINLRSLSNTIHAFPSALSLPITTTSSSSKCCHYCARVGVHIFSISIPISGSWSLYGWFLCLVINTSRLSYFTVFFALARWMDKGGVALFLFLDIRNIISSLNFWAKGLVLHHWIEMCVYCFALYLFGIHAVRW